MRRRIICALAVLTMIAMVANTAWAGRHWRGGRHWGHHHSHWRGHHHYWEGAAIGLGAAIVGGALLNGLFYRPYYRERVVYVQPAQPVVVTAPPVAGYWQNQRVWIPPVTDNVWQDGYYDPNGTWVQGHWREIVKVPGYWHTEKIWIGSR